MFKNLSQVPDLGHVRLLLESQSKFQLRRLKQQCHGQVTLAFAEVLPFDCICSPSICDSIYTGMYFETLFALPSVPDLRSICLKTSNTRILGAELFCISFDICLCLIHLSFRHNYNCCILACIYLPDTLVSQPSLAFLKAFAQKSKNLY